MRSNVGAQGSFRSLLLLVGCALAVSAGTGPFGGLGRPALAASGGQWLMAGQNLSNTRNQVAETTIGPANVGQLTPKWVFTTGGDVSATATVGEDSVYVPDWSGNLFKIDALTGAKI